MFWVHKRTVSEIKDTKGFVIICSYLVKVRPTSDLCYLIMFDNLYVKHNLSNLGDENSLKYLLTGPLGK